MVLTDVACSLPYIRIEICTHMDFYKCLPPASWPGSSRQDRLECHGSDQKCEHAQLGISFNLQYFEKEGKNMIEIKTSKLDISLTILNFWGIGIRAAA